DPSLFLLLELRKRLLDQAGADRVATRRQGDDRSRLVDSKVFVKCRPRGAELAILVRHLLNVRAILRLRQLLQLGDFLANFVKASVEFGYGVVIGAAMFEVRDNLAQKAHFVADIDNAFVDG